MTAEDTFLKKLAECYPELKRPSGSSSRPDPRKNWIAYFKLVKEYPDMEGKLGIEISPFGYTKNGVIPIVEHPENWPEFWEEIK